MDSDNSDSSSDPDTFFEVAESDPMLEDNVRGVMPYRYEPYLDELEPQGSTESSDGEAEGAVGGAAVADGRMPMDFGRLQHVEWCSCGRCEPMPLVVESVCCREQSRVCERREEEGADTRCITEHSGFEPVCLNLHVLRTAHFHYRQEYGDVEGNEWKRYTGYRQFVRWCYEYLGRHVRVPIPSCVVWCIRRTFPSIDYRGFQDTNSP
ncbi:hypothetical protein PBY51_012156 [Eleginops maclovinus]|uniref:P2X purinoreceptor 7 intracellular domain-containing protein n=2 Tax=Eleginops maclovinus TaxID=56733 RepID=A0AAN8AT50_ELEMC|nr:hypothetical protein PBY51_012156 [Eleginops maclovinus]